VGNIKLERAYSGCLGARRRRRAWQAAKSLGESRAGIDPRIPEWGNLIWVIPYHLLKRATRGTETSKYPEEKKETSIPLVVASERGKA